MLTNRRFGVDIGKAIGDIDDQHAIVLAQIEVLQMFIDTGPGDTQAGVDFEQGIVGGALDKGFVEVEKLVFLPLQIYPGVGAAIDKSVEGGIAVHHKHSQRLPLEFELEGTAAGVGDFAGGTELIFHRSTRIKMVRLANNIKDAV